MKENFILLISFTIFIIAIAFTYNNYKDSVLIKSYWGANLYSDDQWLAPENKNVRFINKTEIIEGIVTDMNLELDLFTIEVTNNAVIANDTEPIIRKTTITLPRKVLVAESIPYVYNDTASADIPAKTLEELLERLKVGNKRIKIEAMFKDINSQDITYIKPIKIFFNE